MAKRAPRQAPIGEDQIRLYLTSLTDPSSLIDSDAVQKAETALERARRNGDPIAVVKALTALERAQTVDSERLEAGFVEHIASWMAETGVTASAVLSMNVPRELLVKAGVVEKIPAAFRIPRAQPRSRRNGHRPRPTGAAAGNRQRARNIPLDEIVRKLPAQDQFTVADVGQLIDRGVATARNYVTQMVANGLVEDLGPDRDYNKNGNKGRAPYLYRRTVAVAE